MASAPHKHLDPRVLDRLNRLDFRARLVVEGFVSGMHRSPYRGFSVEFAEHREYVPGDDTRFVDWKVFGRSDRVYIKEFEEETNLRAHVFLDQSESMAYGRDEVTKFDYAATAAASLAYMIQQQADAVGLNLFTDRVLRHVPPKNTRANLNLIFKALEDARPSSTTAVGAVLHELAEKVQKKGLVLIFSDLFDDPDSVLAGLKHVRHKGHDVILFHVLHSDEVEFPFDQMTLFEGLEEAPRLLVDPKALREAYLREIGTFQERIRKGALAQKVDYVRLVTSEPLDVVLSAYVAVREARLKKRR